MQIHHVSQILICAHEPCLGGLESFMKRQKTIQDSIEIVCGIGMTCTEDASSLLSSQCLFIGKPSSGDQLYAHANTFYSRNVHAEPATENVCSRNARLVPRQMRLAHAFSKFGAGTDMGGP